MVSTTLVDFCILFLSQLSDHARVSNLQQLHSLLIIIRPCFLNVSRHIYAQCYFWHHPATAVYMKLFPIVTQETNDASNNHLEWRCCDSYINFIIQDFRSCPLRFVELGIFFPLGLLCPNPLHFTSSGLELFAGIFENPLTELLYCINYFCTLLNTVW
jgi:hypothetical protein